MPCRDLGASSTLLTFLYPSVCRSRLRVWISARTFLPSRRTVSSGTIRETQATASLVNELPETRLNPAPDDYAAPTFADKAVLTLYAGRGGNGCVSFQREAFMPNGPPNGGDGGTGGNIYIRAVHDETSLHKLARQRVMRAGRGRHGQGGGRSGTRGDDVVISVPVGTVVRELERQDPLAEEIQSFRMWHALQKQRKREQREREERRAVLKQDLGEEDKIDEEVLAGGTMWKKKLQGSDEELDAQDPQREKWLLYPGLTKTDIKSTTFPKLPRRTRFLHQPAPGIQLDLTSPSAQPVLLATGGLGGLGNPHFTSREHPRPVFATKGEDAVTMRIELELRLLADVGLVGLPNAGKSTLLRALTNSRTRVGSWAFTTLQPNIGTVVLDRYSGQPIATLRPRADTQHGATSTVAEPRTRFTIADIPGLIEGAHLDRGLGIAFLRHVERASVLAFVIDLGAGDAVAALKALWREVGLYAKMRQDEEHTRETAAHVDWDMDNSSFEEESGPISSPAFSTVSRAVGPESVAEIAGKPWFVVATKADLPGTQESFMKLKTYLAQITSGEVAHPSDVKEAAWTKNCIAIPVSAINSQGVDRIVHWVVELLNQ